MVICPDCGKEVPSAKFCRYCGAGLQDVGDVESVVSDDVQPVVDDGLVLCPGCGKEVPSAKFCRYCGAGLQEVEVIEPVVDEDLVPDEVNEDVSSTISDSTPVEDIEEDMSVVSEDEESVVDNVESSDVNSVVGDESVFSDEVAAIFDDLDSDSDGEESVFSDEVAAIFDDSVPSEAKKENVSVNEEIPAVVDDVVSVDVTEEEPIVSDDEDSVVDEELVVCPDCGKEVPIAKFCRYCGATLPNVNDSDSDEISEEVVSVEDEATHIETSEEESNVKSCPSCGFEIDEESEVCPNCGANLYDIDNSSQSIAVYENKEKNKVLAIILSVILPGLGQFYLKLNHKGLMFLIGWIISIILTPLQVGFILCVVIWLWALIDTIQSTDALNNGELVEDRLLG